MRVCFWNVDDKIGVVLNAVVSIGGQGHQVGPSGFAFQKVAQGFLIEFLLGQDANDQRTRLNQTDGAVLQLPGGVGLGVDITDLLHFQTALQTDGVIQPPADEESVPRCQLLGGEPLNARLVLQNPFHFSGQGLQFLYQRIRLSVLQRSPVLGEHNGQSIDGQ